MYFKKGEARSRQFLTLNNWRDSLDDQLKKKKKKKKDKKEKKKKKKKDKGSSDSEDEWVESGNNLPGEKKEAGASYKYI